MKKLRKLLAMLLAVCMAMSLLSVSTFAAEEDEKSKIQIVKNGDKVYYLANGGEANEDAYDVWTSKTIKGTKDEDVFEVTLQVGTTMKAIPNDVAVVLVMDVSGSMLKDASGYTWGRYGALPTDGRKLRIDYAREAAMEFAEQLVKDSGGAQRMLSIVQFGNNAMTLLPWTDANDNGTLNEEVEEKISSVGVNFIYDNRSFWDEDWIEENNIQIKDSSGTWKVMETKNWVYNDDGTNAVYTHATKDYHVAASFESHCKTFMTEYTTTMVPETVDGTEVTICTACTEEGSQTHCNVVGCSVADTHSHCTYAGCSSTGADHQHCTYPNCQNPEVAHTHCAVAGCDVSIPHSHCTYADCNNTEAEHKHCTYSICANPSNHNHCDRRFGCSMEHVHCWDIQVVCGRTDVHEHVVGCTVEYCQDTTAGHEHACIHGAVMGEFPNYQKYIYPFYDMNFHSSGEDASTAARCLNSDPNHTHDVYDSDSYHGGLFLNRIHQAWYYTCTNMEGGLTLARNLVNTGKAKGGAIEDIDDIYVILLSDGMPTWHINQSALAEADINTDTEIGFFTGERGGSTYAEWEDVADIINDSLSGDDVALVDDIKEEAEFYAILYGKDLDGNLGGDHPLSQISAAKWFKEPLETAENKENYVYPDLVIDSPEANGVSEAFLQIKNRIDVLAKAWTVTDELSDDVSFGEFVKNGEYASVTPASGDKNETISWSLGGMEPEDPNAAGGVDDPFVYTLKYRVTLNSAQDDVKEISLAYDANEADENSDVSLPGVWTGNDTSLQYFMITKEELNGMPPAEIQKLLREADFDDVSVKGIYGGLSFIKKHSETGEVMPGVGFTLYDSANKAYGEEVFSDSEGVVAFSNIPRGIYTLKETNAPVNMQVVEVRVKESWGAVTTLNGEEVKEILNYPVGSGGGNNNSGSNDGGEGGSTVEPSNPGGSTPSGPSNPSGPSDPTEPTTPPDTTIEDEDTPLGQLPEEDVELGEEDVPLGSLPEEEPPLAVLPEEDVPLAVLPTTGDASVIWMALSALSGAGLFLTRKKRDEE